jgi:hypothetical protein
MGRRGNEMMANMTDMINLNRTEIVLRDKHEDDISEIYKHLIRLAENDNEQVELMGELFEIDKSQKNVIDGLEQNVDRMQDVIARLIAWNKRLSEEVDKTDTNLVWLLIGWLITTLIMVFGFIFF